MRRDCCETSTAVRILAGQHAADLRASHDTVCILPTGALGHCGGHKDSQGTSVVSKVLWDIGHLSKALLVLLHSLFRSLN